MKDKSYPVAVIGAGPIGLAAAAHLLDSGETPLVLEMADGVGGNIRSWAHVPTFSPWQYNVDKVSQTLLETHGWQMPTPAKLPTGQEIIDEYLVPLAETPELAPHIQFNAKVTGISRRRIDKMKDANRSETPFVIYADVDGEPQRFLARAVIDASGTWATPNPIGADGMPAPGEAKHADRIFYGIPDVLAQHSHRYANKTVAVIGGGHSAINAILELGDLQNEYPDTKIIWVMRKASATEAYGGLEGDALPGRGLLGIRIKEMVEANALDVVTPFFVLRIDATGERLNISGETLDGETSIQVDEIIAATGSRPDTRFLQELRVELDPSVESTPALAPLIDPNIHSCGSVRPHGEAELRHPEKDFYIVGMKSYGRAPTFLLATGYEQVRSVVAGLVGDWDAARAVELDLPETGVCGGTLSSDLLATASAGACCDTVNEALTLVNGASDLTDLGLEEKLAGCCGSTTSADKEPVAASTENGACCGTVDEVITLLDKAEPVAAGAVQEKLSGCCSG